MSKFIVAGGPVANRAWVLHEHLISMLTQDYPAELLKLVYLVADSKDRTVEVLQWFADRFPGRIVWEELTTPTGAVSKTHRWHMAYMSDLRNRWLDLAMREGADAFWIADSDTIPPPETLSLLVEHDRPVVGPAVCMTPQAEFYRFYNGGIMNRDGMTFLVKSHGLQRVDFLTANFLIQKHVFDKGIRWDPEPPAGEDEAFCEALRKAGVPMYLDWGIEADHRKASTFTDMWRRPETRGIMAEYFQAG